MPSNDTPAAAIDITSLPYSVSADPTGAADSTYLPSCSPINPATLALWWKYTPPAGVTVIGMGFQAASDVAEYIPLMSVWTGPDVSSLTQVPFTCWQWDQGNAEYLVQLAVTPGTTYYFQFTNWWFTPPGSLSNLEFRVVASTPSDAIQTGDYLISNDTTGFPTAFVIPGTGALRALTGKLGAFEQAAMLPNGNFLAAVINSSYYTTSFKIYDTNYDVLATITSPIVSNQNELGGVSTDGTNFYAICGTYNFAGANGASLVKISPAGAVLQTWTLPAPAGNSSGLAIDSVNGIAYWVAQLGSHSGQKSIFRHNLNTDTPMSNLVDETAGTKFGRDLELTAAGDLLAHLVDNLGVYKMKRYSTADGSVLMTYTIATFTGTAGTPRFRIDPNTPTQFVLFTLTAEGGSSGTGYTQTSTFQRFDITSATAVSSVTSATRQDNESGPLTPMFAISQSCPILFAVAATPPANTFGLYQVVAGKRNDVGSPIPDPFFVTALFGDE